LAELELPDDERNTVDACLRQIDFLNTEIAHVDRQLAEHALQSDEIKRLMTIPGIDVTTAATLIAAIGDIHRFPSAKKLVGYLGIDPRVRQSGQSPARQGRISKQGSSNCRHVLGEAAWSAVKTPGPLRAFYQRVKARRGAQVAIVATARKLACLCWQLLTTEQDYAFKRQTTVDRKLRALELRAWRAHPQRRATQQGDAHDQAAGLPRTATHRASRTRLSTADPGLAIHRQQPEWCGRRTGARITKAVRHSSAAGINPRTCALARGHPHHPKPSHAERNPSTQPLMS
jgi:hypothetical protein